MKTKLDKVENNLAEFEIEIPAVDFEVGIGKAYKQNATKFNLPGFRKGKAPQKMVEKFYGVEVFYEDAINILLPDAYDKAVEELGLDTVDRPEVDVTQVGRDQDMIVTFKVYVKPEAEVSNYKGIEIEKIEYNVSDEQIDSELNQRQERNARMINVEDKPACDGDTVTIDFEGIMDGEPFEGGKAEGHQLTLGSGQFIPGFEPQLVGMNIGDEKTIDVSFPEDYHAEDLAGKPVQFNVKLHAISAKELPVLDDEFAKDVSEFDTLDELKADIRAKLEEQAVGRQKAETENAVIDKLVEFNPLEVPEAMVESQIENFARDFEMRLNQQGMNLEKYLEFTGTSIDDFKDQHREQASKQVKANLLVEAVAKAEKIEATDQDVEAEYSRMAEQYKMEVDKIKSFINEDMLKKDLLTQKAVDFLVSSAKKVPAKKTSNNEEKPAKKPAVKKTTAKEKKEQE